MSAFETTSPESELPVESPVDPAVLAVAKANILARGGQARAMTVLSYPATLLNDLLERLADHRQRPSATLEWLAVETAGRDLAVPSKTAFYDFYKLVRTEYRLAMLADRRREAESYMAAVAEGDADAQQLVLNRRLTELLTDELMRAGDAGQIDTKRLFTLISGTRAVAQTVFDKAKMDAKIAALAKEIEHREATIQILKQRIERLPDQVKKLESHLEQIEKAQAAGKKVDAGVYAAIRAELTKVKGPAEGGGT